MPPEAAEVPAAATSGPAPIEALAWADDTPSEPTENGRMTPNSAAALESPLADPAMRRCPPGCTATLDEPPEEATSALDVDSAATALDWAALAESSFLPTAIPPAKADAPADAITSVRDTVMPVEAAPDPLTGEANVLSTIEAAVAFPAAEAEADKVLPTRTSPLDAETPPALPATARKIRSKAAASDAPPAEAVKALPTDASPDVLDAACTVVASVRCTAVPAEAVAAAETSTPSGRELKSAARATLWPSDPAVSARSIVTALFALEVPGLSAAKPRPTDKDAEKDELHAMAHESGLSTEAAVVAWALVEMAADNERSTGVAPVA